MTLHERLIARQSDAEIGRKKSKAQRRGIWTQEDIDWAYRKADHWLQLFAGESKQATSYVNEF